MASEYSLGTARAKIVIDASGASTVLIQTENEVNKFAKNLSNTSDTMVRSGAAIGSIGVVVAAGFATAIKSAANFQTELNGIKAVSGATAQEMELIRAKALQLGKDTKYSASEAAQGMAELAKAGVQTKDILNGAADATVALAAAGSVTLPEAATISANAMNAFALSAQELPHVADLIAGAANASAIDVKEFGYSLQASGAVAHLAGVSFDDLAVAIAEMGNAGIKGSDAGTSLKTFLQNLIPQTEKEKTLFKELGLVTKDGANQFFDAAGKAKSLADISGVLQNSLKGMTQEQKLNTLGMAFGSDAIRAAAIMSENGSEGFNKLAASMGKVTAADVAKTRMEGLNGSMEQLKGSAETLAIQVGTPLLGAVNKLVVGITSLIGKFLELSPTTQKIIVAIVGIIGAFALFAGGALIAIGAIGHLVIGFKAFMAAMKVIKAMNLLTRAMTALNASFLTNPIFLIIVAIIAIGAAIYLAYKHFEPFRKVVDSVGRALATAFIAVVGFFKQIPGYVSSAFNTIKSTITGVPDLFVKGFNGVLTFWKNLGASISSGISTGFDAVVGFFARLPGLIGTALVAMLSAVGTFLAQLPIKIAYWLGFAIGAFIRFYYDMYTGAIEFGIKFIAAIIDFMSKLPGRIWDFLVAAYNFMVEWRQKMIDKAVEVGTNILNAITEFFSKLPGRAWGFLVDVFNFVVRWHDIMVNKAIELGSRFLNTIVDFFSKLPGRVWDFLNAVIDKAIQWRESMLDKARSLGSSFKDGVINGLEALPGAVSGIYDKALQVVKDKIKDAFNVAKNLAGSMWNGFKDGLGIHSPSYIERASTNIAKNVMADTRSLASQMKILNNMGNSMNELTSNMRSQPMQLNSFASVAGGGNVSLEINVNGVSSAEAAKVKATLSSKDVLTKIVNAAKAGRK